jgi:hypothetical protein
MQPCGIIDPQRQWRQLQALAADVAPPFTHPHHGIHDTGSGGTDEPRFAAPQRTDMDGRDELGQKGIRIIWRRGRFDPPQCRDGARRRRLTVNAEETC